MKMRRTAPVEIRVYYKDTDTAGVVYYANYLRFFEVARTEYLRQLGFAVEDFMAAGVLFVVVRVEIDYHAPAHYGDVLEVSTSPTQVKPASFCLAHQIHRKTDQRLIAEGNTRLGCINSQGRPIRLPENLLSCLKDAM